MHRIFGKAKPKEPTPTLDDASASMEKRGGEVDGKIKQLDEELLRYKTQMSKMRPGPAKNQVQQRALRVLKQKKMYEKQRDSLYNQSFNVDQTRFALQNVKDTVTTVAAMKAASVDLKASMKQVKIDDVEDLHDDMADMLEDAEEVNEVLGRAYGVPDELNEDDLMDELGALEDELAQEESEELPSYLLNAASASKSPAVAVDASPAAAAEKPVAAPRQEVAVDAFGLPLVPMRNLNA